MPNRDGTWPQGKGKMTGKGMGACQSEWKQGQNIPFGNGQWKKCGRWMKRGLWNRRTNHVEESQENSKNEEV